MSRAFLSGLMRDWCYVNAKALTWKRYEVLNCLPWMEGIAWSWWSTWIGRSGSQSQKVVSEIKYSREEYNFKQYSATEAWRTITSQDTFKILRLEWDTKLVKIFRLDLQRESAFKMNMAKINYSWINLNTGEIYYFEDLPDLVQYSLRSIFEEFSKANFSNFSCEMICKRII